jgi:hypothetical protein
LPVPIGAPRRRGNPIRAIEKQQIESEAQDPQEFSDVDPPPQMLEDVQDDDP